ncbi:MAG TPA: hypothetical protein VG478_11880 [Acidimicrobiales bacterium]|jgi:hypothetical protein|nr:hypothetical protein [Acidimicrobiales bacterium]
MSSRTAAELSSLESQLDQLIARVGTLARAAEPGRRDDLIVTLHEVERALREARRQTAQATRLV